MGSVLAQRRRHQLLKVGQLLRLGERTRRLQLLLIQLLLQLVLPQRLLADPRVAAAAAVPDWW